MRFLFAFFLILTSFDYMKLLFALLLIFSINLNNHSTNTESVDDLLQLAKHHASVNPDSAVIYAEMSLRKSIHLEYQYGEARSHFIMGYVADELGEIDKAVPELLIALEKYDALDTKKSLIDRANICVTLGKIYRQHFKNKTAIEFYERGRNYAEKTDNNKVLLKLLNNQAIAHRHNKEFKAAVDLLKYKLSITPISNERELNKAYNQLGLINRDLKNYEESREWYTKMIKLEEGKVKSRYRAQAYHNIANTFFDQKAYGQSERYFLNALTEKQRMNRPKDLFITYIGISELNLVLGKSKQAESYGLKALALYEKVDKTPDYFNVYHILSRSVRGYDESKALVYSDNYIAENEIYSLRQNEIIQNAEQYKIDLIASEFFTSVKERAVKAKNIRYLTVIITAFLSILVFIWFLNYRKKLLLTKDLKNAFIDINLDDFK